MTSTETGFDPASAPAIRTRSPRRPEREKLPLATVLLTLALAAEIFSGNWGNFGVPGAADRVLLVLGLVAFVVEGRKAMSERPLRLRPIHLLLLGAAAYATISSIGSHTFDLSTARFALLDRFGLVPFLLFCLAPVVYRRERSRRFLLAVLIIVGAYIGITNFFEGIGANALVFPQYITDPAVGIHFGRARGPFVESVADGLSLVMCSVAAAIGMTVWRKLWIRVACAAVIAISALGILLTVTRAVWIAAVLAAVVAMLAVKQWRKYLLPVAVLVTVGVVAAFALVPSLQSKADTRLNDQAPVWDRYNTNNAAIRMIEARPLFGFGWQTFPTKGLEYMRQADKYPLPRSNLEVHNVFLSHAAELGLVGSLLWLGAFLSAIGGALLRRGPPELHAWRIGLLAIFAAFISVAMFGPLSYPFPNAMMWTWAGIAGAPYFLGEPDAAPARQGESR
jgi:O-antigen ligase